MLKMFDELGGERVSMDYSAYFGEMDLSEEEKEERTELASQLEVLFLFLLMAYQAKDAENSKSVLQEKYKNIAMSFIGSKKQSSYIAEYSRKIIEETIRVTNENLDDPYYTSWDRAIFIAENEANAIGGYRQQLRAIKSGKKNKTWVTMSDKKVRHTHREVDGATIPIFESFQVGNSKMMFPKDHRGESKEVVNCRCILKYS